MSIEKRIKAAFNRYLERLAKENKELFGDGRPNCCKLNRQKQETCGGNKNVK